MRVQVASKKFKSRLKIFDELSRVNRKYLAIKAVFDRIPEDSKFIVVPGKIDDTILYHPKDYISKFRYPRQDKPDVSASKDNGYGMMAYEGNLFSETK